MSRYSPSFFWRADTLTLTFIGATFTSLPARINGRTSVMNSRSSSLNFRYYYVSHRVITHTFAAWFKSYIYLKWFGFTEILIPISIFERAPCNKFRKETFLPSEEKGKWRIQRWLVVYSMDGKIVNDIVPMVNDIFFFFSFLSCFFSKGNNVFHILSYSLEFHSESNLRLYKNN